MIFMYFKFYLKFKFILFKFILKFKIYYNIFNKYQGINLTEEVKYFYIEIYKTNIAKQVEGYSIFEDQMAHYCKDNNSLPIDHIFTAVPNKISTGNVVEIDKCITKMYIKM